MVVGVIFLTLISCAGAIAMSLSNLSSASRNTEGLILSGRHAMTLAESGIAEVLGEFTKDLGARTAGQDLKSRFQSMARQGVVAGPDIFGVAEMTFEPLRTRSLLAAYGPGYSVGPVTLKPVDFRLERNFGTLTLTGSVTVRESSGRDTVWTVTSFHHFVLKCDGVELRVDPVPFQVVPYHRRRS